MSEPQTPYLATSDQPATTTLSPDNQSTQDELKDIPTTLIDRPDKSVRMSIDPKYVQELADSIREQTLLQPIIVFKKGERYGIIAGDRRFLAVSLLMQPTIACIIKKVTPQQIHMQRAIENLQRENMTPIEEAHTYRDLLDNFNLTIEEVAKRTGKKPTHVKRRVDLLKMPQCLQDAIHARQISYSVAEALDGIKDLTSLNYYLTFAIENGVTMEVARQWLKDWQDAARRAQSDTVSIESLPPAMSSKPVFYACDTCCGAVEINQIKSLRCCPDCFNIIRANLNSSQ